MALNGLNCAYVPLRNYSLTHAVPLRRAGISAAADRDSCINRVKGFPYSLLSVGPGADPDVQAVSPQVNIGHPHGMLPYTFYHACGYLPSRRASPPLDQYQVILLGDRGT